MDTQFTILRQLDQPQLELRIAAQYAMLRDIPMRNVRMEGLEAHEDALRQGNVLPIGSVEFLRKAMSLANVCEPENISYPEVLRSHLHREVSLTSAGAVNGQWFVKPVETKKFTGFVLNTGEHPGSLSPHDYEQWVAFLSMGPDEPVWISQPVTWLSEFRYYVLDGKICGYARYDDGTDDMPEPDMNVVCSMVATMSSESNTPAGFCMDIGVLDTGQTALVECNDGWSLGFYKGTLSHQDYMNLLWRRWRQLIHP